MRKIVDVVDHDIVTQIATDDGAVVQPHRHAQIMVFQKPGLQSADPNQTEKLAVTHQIGIEGL